MPVKSCSPVIPSTDLEKSLRFWVEGLGLTADCFMRSEGRLVGCMVRNEHVWFWLNERGNSNANPDGYESIRLYWYPDDIHAQRAHLLEVGFSPSEIEVRHYGQTEFSVTDDDGHSHCFGVVECKKEAAGMVLPKHIAKPIDSACDECGSMFFAKTSGMDSLCPECAHVLYGKKPCAHHFVKGRCSKCNWDGSESKFIKSLKMKKRK